MQQLLAGGGELDGHPPSGTDAIDETPLAKSVARPGGRRRTYPHTSRQAGQIQRPRLQRQERTRLLVGNIRCDLEVSLPPQLDHGFRYLLGSLHGVCRLGCAGHSCPPPRTR
jgi:hypothetical protein